MLPLGVGTTWPGAAAWLAAAQLGRFNRGGAALPVCVFRLVLHLFSAKSRAEQRRGEVSRGGEVILSAFVMLWENRSCATSVLNVFVVPLPFTTCSLLSFP